MVVRAGPREEASTLAAWPPHHRCQAISRTTLCGPDKAGKLRHGASTRQLVLLALELCERLKDKQQSDSLPGPPAPFRRGTVTTVLGAVI